MSNQSKIKIPIFKRTDFIDAGQYSINFKLSFANQFVRFVVKRFDYGAFNNWFYNQLSRRFGFMRHFDRETFYSVYFTNNEDRLLFFDKISSAVIIDAPQVSMSDVERKIQEWVIQEKFVEFFKEKVKENKKYDNVKHDLKFLTNEQIGVGAVTEHIAQQIIGGS